jgi:serine/threonine-protein kinase RsbW
MLMTRSDLFRTNTKDDQEPYYGWRVTRLSSVGEMTAMLDALVADLADLDYSSKDIFGIRLALEESICNSIKHGHQYDSSKVVEVRLWVAPDRVVVEVKDEGRGFDPSRVPDPTTPEHLQRACGRGLLLIRHYAAWVRHNSQGNCIAFCICASEVVFSEEAAIIPADALDYHMA